MPGTNVKQPELGESRKIGIFSGTFDPVHAGHIAFALESIEKAGLSMVYFLPEQVPRRKDAVTHYAHRVAMLRLALKPHNQLKLLELPDKQFSVHKTLPRLKRAFPEGEMYLLIGSDMIDLLISPKAAEQWPGFDRFLGTIKIIVAVRNRRLTEENRQKIDLVQPGALAFASHKPQASSRDIRVALMNNKNHKDVLPSIHSYIKTNWLYTSVAGTEPLSAKNS